MIHAGSVAEVKWGGGAWVFLDIGFSNKVKSCGLLINDLDPEAVRFNEAQSRILDLVETSGEPVKLMIEAPLSVAFDKSGNPTGRSIEKQDGKTRYWYNGLGCGVMVAAMYLLREIQLSAPNRTVLLFEAFVSYKDRKIKSDHRRDVRLMREVVKDPAGRRQSIISPEELGRAAGDQVKSAFCVAGMDCGVPPVIRCDG
jgi:hypothetical protein